jgi:hypothetical protein
MATDPWAQLVGLIIQSIGAIVLAAIFWLVNLAYKSLKRIHARLDHLDKCVDGVRKEAIEDRKEVKAALAATEARDKHYQADILHNTQQIGQLKTDYAGLEGWVKGWAKLPIDKPITEIDPRNGVS